MASLAELDTSSYITELDKTPCIHEVFSTTDIPDIPQIRKEIEVPNNALSIISKEFINQPENIKNPTDICIVNTRVFLDELSEKYNKPITIGTIPESEWQELFKDHTSFWFMGIYKESQAGQDFCQKNPYCIRDVEYEIERQVNPEKDIGASSFSIPEYTINLKIAPGGWSEWDKMVDYLHQHNKKVFTDFVPNHVALDHSWATEHPDYFIQGTEEQFQKTPSLYYNVVDKDNNLHHIAHGKDPNYPQWDDTLQLNYANPDLQAAMIEVLIGNENGLINHCDGLRCDMAMLLNSDTFIRTWGDKYFGGHLPGSEISYIKNNEFWPKVIAEVKARVRELGRDDFTFIAEAYWDIDKLGKNFDGIYYKELYDSLQVQNNDGNSISINHDNIRELLSLATKDRDGNNLNFKWNTFIENHDEQRAVKKFGEKASKAAAVISAFGPFTFLMNQNQEKGYRYRIPAQFRHHLSETTNLSIKNFYDQILKLRNSRLCQKGEWSVVWPNPKMDSRIITVKYTLEDQTLYITTNYCDQTSYGNLTQINHYDNAKVASLTDNKVIENFDQDRSNGLFIKLNPWESQIIFVDRKSNIN